MLEYRLRRLPAARDAARVLGRQGARFAWESATTGRDVTPRSARDLTGRLIPIRTGLLEEHITADVAWAACVYADWSGDEAFLRGEGLPLVVETARYWASRIKSDGRGRGHIFGVIGPDEYHEPVDDNAFTNVMARWNLRKAAQLTEGGAGGVGEAERRRWLEAAGALVDGYDPQTRRYEQCSGFYRLEPILIADLARRPVTADALLGRERIRGTQVVKQADVLMLHHMVPEETAPGSLAPNLAYYEPRTAHGSSLSPGIHAALFAREGMLDEAVRALDLAARMDLDDLSNTSADGMHLATMGSVWQALAWGFAGMRPDGSVLRMNPHVPESWGSMEIRVRFRACPLVARFEPGRVALTPGGVMAIAVGDGAGPIRIGPGPAELFLDDDGWRVRP
jgi:trehalose/maltose hydrolase-like predicted phosphorylase